MNADRSTSIKWIFAACLVCSIVLGIWFINQPSIHQDDSGKTPVMVEQPRTIQQPLPEPIVEPASEPPAANPPPEPAIHPQRLRSIARETFLQLLDLDSGSIAVSRAAIALMGLNPSQVEDLNKLVKEFVEAVQAQEIAHASVVNTVEGGEEIVIAPFDRFSLFPNFRSQIANKFGESIADFVVEQATYDHTLSMAKAEMRLCIRRQEDGLDHFIVQQHALRRDAPDPEKPFFKDGIHFAPTYNSTTNSLLGNGVGERFAPLFSAVDRLPRRLAAPQ